MIRKTFLTSILVILFILVFLFNGWNPFHINDGIKKIFVSKLRSMVGDQFTIDRISLGFGSINLEGVNLDLQDAPYELWIEELRLGYNLGSLLRGTIDIERSAEDVTIYKPKLTLLYSSKKESRPNVDLSLNLSKEAEKTYRSFLKETGFIKKIVVSEGEIALFDEYSSTKIPFAKNINGWVSTDEQGRAWLRMAGNIFETDEFNMRMYGEIDLDKGRIEKINLDLRDYKIGNDIPFLLPDYLDVLSGVVNGHLTITERPSKPRGFNIVGSVALKGGRARHKSENLFFDDINITADVKDWNLEIKEARQMINGSPVVVKGRIKGLLDPELDLRVCSAQLNVEEFLTQLIPNEKLPLTGKAQLDFTLTDKIASPVIQGTMRSDSIGFYVKALRHVDIDFSFKDLYLEFSKISGTLGEGNLNGKGSINFKYPEKITDFELDISGNLSKELYDFGIVSADHGIGSAQIRVFGPIQNLVSRGNFNLGFSKESTEALAFNGSFRYTRGRGFLSASSTDNEFRLNVSADSLLSQPKFVLQASNAEKLLVFVNSPLSDFIRNHYNFQINLEGNADSFHSVIDGYRPGNYEKLVRITADAKTSKDFAGDIELFPNTGQSVTGKFATEFQDGSLKLTQLELGDWLRGEFDTPESKSPWHSKVSITGLRLGLLLSFIDKQDLKFDGDLVGQLTFGTTADPSKISGNLWLLGGFLRDLGPIKGEMAFEANSEKIEIKKFSFESNESLYLKGVGKYNFDSEEVAGSIAGSNVRIEDILKLFTRRENIVQGNAFLQVSFNGKYPKIPLYGNAEVNDAKILMLEFDKIKFAFGDETNSSGSYFSKGLLYFSDATLEKQDQFVVKGSAQLPLNDDHSLAVQLSGDGNFLALLPDLAEIFEGSESTGHLDLNYTGHYKTPDFTGSKLKFESGTLRLSSVAKKIKNLEGELAVLPDDYFLDIRKLKGTIKDKPISIANTRAFHDSLNIDFEPLRIGGYDLNLGALLVRTSSSGVPLNIPGLMAGGDLGWYSFEGKPDTVDGIDFFIAGPWERPKIRGTIKVQHANVMFPFDESMSEGHPIVMNIMNNIDWDVKAKSVKDTRYVTQFPAGGLYVDMEVDKDNSELYFTGVLKDSTFRIDGTVESIRGEIEYFDLNFRVEKFGAEFNRTLWYPNVYGKAWTVVRDTSNVPTDVYLTLVTADDLNRDITKGRWDRINIKLSSEYPTYAETQGEVMATLGYSSTTIDEKARKAVGYSTDSFIFRPLMRPIERQLERSLGLDVVRFSYAFTQNFLDSNFSNDQLRSSLAYLRSSRLILGKYLTEDIYLLYTGELKSGIDYQFQEKGVGLQHILGLEYRLARRWLLQMEYDYNSLLETHKDDKKFWLRHSFPF